MIDLYVELSDSSRRKILLELYDAPKGVNALAAKTGLKQPNVSNHLSRLRFKNIVTATKSGRDVIYSLNGPEVERIVGSLLGNADQLPPVELSEMATTYARLAAAGEEEACAAIFETLFKAKTPLIDIYEGVVTPAMKKVGQWWKVGAIDEGQEHLAFSITQSLLYRARQVAGIGPRISRTVVSGCAPACLHEMGLTVVTDYLRFEGWRVFSLGQDVPIKAFVNAVRLHCPDLVLTNIQSEVGIAPALELVTALKEAREEIGPFKIAVGGALAKDHKEALLAAGADYVPSSLKDFAENIVPKVSQPVRVAKEFTT